MGLRPAKTCREVNKVAWSRFSRKKPRKSYVKAIPHNKLTVFSMGAKGDYEVQLDMVAKEPVQIRDNSLEAARQTINKHLEKTLLTRYLLKVRVYPHNVIRENKMISGAGADRLSKGMRLSFGRPSDIAARIAKGQAIYSAFVMEKDVEVVKEAYKRGKSKLPGQQAIIIKILKEKNIA